MFRFSAYTLSLGLFACSSTGILSEPSSAVPTEAYWQDAQEFYTDRVFKKSIHTVQLFQKGFELSAPLLELNGQEALVLRFDDLDDQLSTYSYEVRLCNADWTESQLSKAEYLTGAFADHMQPGTRSFGTMVPYVNYSLEFPSTMMRPKISGNYVFRIYKNEDPEDLILTRRFMVYENRVEVDARVTATRMVEERDQAQHVDLTIRHSGVPIQDPFGDVNVTVLQNMNWESARTGFKPKFVRGTELIYDQPLELMFMGGNEWRNFDLKDLRYAMGEVAGVQRIGDHFVAQLMPDDKRNIRVHLEQADINGRFLVKNDEARDHAVESDYVLVKFAYPSEVPMNRDIYVFGGLSDFRCLPEMQMEWNAERRSYEASIFLKQGYYNYAYAIKDRYGNGDITVLEGTHYETENDYLVLIYLRQPTMRNDALIGIRNLNSRRDR